MEIPRPCLWLDRLHERLKLGSGVARCGERVGLALVRADVDVYKGKILFRNNFKRMTNPENDIF